MARYFFDMSDAAGATSDIEGSEHGDLAAAEREALETLLLMGRERFPVSGPGSLRLDVRDQWGGVRLRLELTLTRS